MTKQTTKAFKTILLVAGSFFFWSCESDPDGLGSQFFDDDTAQGTKVAYDLIAYNIPNFDTIKADGRIDGSTRKDTVVIGAFSEPQFGLQKSAFVSQIRMSSYEPDFGTNAKIDSVVMTLRPKYYAKEDSIKTTTIEDFTWPVDNVAAKKVVKTYPVYKYGKAKTSPLTIKVHEVSDFLGSVNDTIYSNKVVGLGPEIGSYAFNGSITSVDVTKKTDNASLLTRPAGIRISLDKDYFKTKILDKAKSSDLSNLSNFIRYFKGLRISIQENDGYLMKMNQSSTEITMYYKHDVTKDGTTKSTDAKFTFDLGNSNPSFSQITYNRAGTAIQSVLAGSNSTTGDAKLYAQGMGGPNFGAKIPESAITQLKDLYKNEKVGILSAKMRFYTDQSVWNNSLEKPKAFTAMEFKGKNVYDFLTEMKVFGSLGNFQLVKSHDLDKNPAYYDITITQTLKDMVEKEETAKPFVMKVGSYLVNGQTSAFYGANVDSRIYTPNRVVLVGTDAGNAKRAQLLVTYTKK